MPETRSRAWTPARLIAVMALGLAGTATPTNAQIVHTFPGCAATLQACIDAAAPGDVVRIATDEPIAQPAQIRRSLTLEAAPGASPTFQAGSGLFVSPLGADAVDVTVRGLTLERGTIEVRQGSTGPLAVSIVGNVVRDSRTPLTPAIDLSGFVTVPQAGPVTFEIRDNEVFASKPPLGDPIGIRVAFGDRADAHGVIAGNTVFLGDERLDGNGALIVVRNTLRDMTVDVVGNVLSGFEPEHGIRLEQDGEGGVLTARVVSNLVAGADPDGDDELYAISVDATAGSLTLGVVNNTTYNVAAGIDVRASEAVIVDGLVANNLVARTEYGITFDAPALAATDVVANLVFDFVESHLAPGTLLDDPRLGPDLRPGPGSPALDAGRDDLVPADLAIDVAGNPRTFADAVDIGAFEIGCPDGTFVPGCAPDTGPGPDPGPDPGDGTCTAASCDDADPCTIDTCADGTCVHEPLAGVAGALCACERPEPAACAAQPVPQGVTRKSARACRLLGRAAGATATARQERLLRRAARLWERAARQVTGRRVRRTVADACSQALGVDLRDAGTRAANVAASR